MPKLKFPLPTFDMILVAFGDVYPVGVGKGWGRKEGQICRVKNEATPRPNTKPFGRQVVIDQQLDLTAVRIKPDGEASQKAEYVRGLGSEKVAAIGQGANDAEMLAVTQLGICVMSLEGIAKEALLSADLVVPGILPALELLEKPNRIVASLRR